MVHSQSKVPSEPPATGTRNDTCRPESSAVEAPIPLAQVVRDAEVDFQQRCGRPPRWIAAAPGRVNLIGEHTDYNDGFVMPMAIERYVVIAASPSDSPGDGSIQLVSSTTGQTQRLFPDTSTKEQVAPWARYVLGVVAGCRQRGYAVGDLDVVIESTVPLGGGLSSSAALEVATATLLEAVTGRTLEPVEKALICQKAEHDFAGMPCGIMDQFTSVLGRQDHLMLLDCRSRQTTLVPLQDPTIQVLIVNTNVKHELTGGEYAQRRAQCEAAARHLGVPALRDATPELLEQHRPQLDSLLYRRARHVITENERTTAAARALTAGEWDRVGQWMYQSHASLRDDYEVSCPELDLLVELTRQQGAAHGVIGSRMTGGGFGGCTVSLVRAADLPAVASAIRRQYHQQTGIQPSLFTTRPAQGAQIIRGAGKCPST